MRKTLSIIIATCVLILSGCQSIANVQKMSQSGFTDMSCSQISSVFNSYKNDKTTLDALLAIGGLSTDSFGKGLTDSEIFNQAKDAANIALIVKGCGTSV